MFFLKVERLGESRIQEGKEFQILGPW
jgi:hypothetical protein